MGRPLFSESSSAADRAMETGTNFSVDAANNGKGPRRWCKKDAYPDEESWWVGREVFIEAFLEPATKGANLADGASVAHRSSRESLKPNVLPNDQEASSDRLTPEQQSTDTQLPEMQIQNSTIPARFTISEEELSNTKLDTMVEDSDDDFDLAWDSSDEEGDMDLDFETVTSESHSDASTPAPSTPMIEAEAPSLPIEIPSIPSISRHCTLPATPSTPVKTPNRSNSVHNSLTTPSSSPIPARSIPRVRGFAVHSPRTELVL